MTDATSDPAQAILAAIRRLEAGTGRDSFAAEQIIEEMRRVEASVDEDAVRREIGAGLAQAPPGEERLEAVGDDLYRRRGGDEPVDG
jgi:hypothetical protein